MAKMMTLIVMRKIWISVVGLLGAVGLLALVGCGDKPDSNPADVSKSEVHMMPDRGHPPVLGIVPAFQFRDGSLTEISSENLRGQSWTATFTEPPSYLTQIESRCVVLTPDSLGSEQEVRRIHEAVVEGNGSFVLVDAYLRIRGRYQFDDPLAEAKLRHDMRALGAEILNVPADLRDNDWLKQRAKEQIEGAASLGAYHDFSFTDQCEASGIRFMHKIVDESGKRFKGVHYDHGSGVAVADVDGDGHLDIYFVNQVGANELWRNLGDGKFENITERAGVFVSDRIGVSASFADIDNDGDPDLYVTTLRKGNVLFENLGEGRFRNITAASGLGYKGHSSAAVFFDYDRDGLLDLFLANVGQYTKEETINVTMESIRGEADTGDQYYVGFEDAFAGHLKSERLEPSRLYRNQGKNRFVDVTDSTGLDDQGWTGDAAPIDINADGWTDLYLLNMQGNDQVFLNREGQRFERAQPSLFPKTSWGAMGIKAFDFENDGDLDIYITDMHSDMSQHIGPEREFEKSEMRWPPSFLQTEGTSIYGNAFYRRKADGSYEEVSDAIGAENYWPWGLSTGDLNADGYEDVFVTASMNFPLRYSTNLLLLNDQGNTFRNAEFILGVEPRANGMAVPWFELELAGRDKEAPVLNVLQREEEELAKLPERVVVWGAMGSRSSVIFDLDDDGDLDIVTNEMNQRPMVLISDLSEQKTNLSYLNVQLVGKQSNRSGRGAVVRVTAGESTWMKVNDGQSGYLSHSDFPLYFGLDDQKSVDQIEVDWPSGIKQIVNGPIDLNQVLRIEESGEAAAAPSTNTQEVSKLDEGTEAIHVRPGEAIQEAIEEAAKRPTNKRVIVHAGTYRPRKPAQALLWFNKRHEGVRVEAEGEVILTAANPDMSKSSDPSYPAIVNHVVYFGDGITRKTGLKGFKITGANGFLTTSEEPLIQPDIDADNLEKAKFFYTDGGGIKIFGRSFPTIEQVEVYDNFTSPCGAGVSVEHRGHTDGSRRQSVLLRDCIFRNNRCPVSGAAVDLLHGSSAEIINCLFVNNASNEPMDDRAADPGKWKPQYGSGALTIFPKSRVIVRRCTFTGNRNAIDDSSSGNLYEDSLLWMNHAPGGWPTGSRYEFDIASGVGVTGCHMNGEKIDIHNVIDPENNVLHCADPKFDDRYVPQAPGFENVGYRPPHGATKR